MVENVALVDLQAQRADVGSMSGFAGPMMFYVTTGQAAENKAGNKDEQILGKHEQTLSFGLNRGI
jgi:hypothetical protein